MTVLEWEAAEKRYVAVGDVVAGKYLVEGVLGAGGMAFVLSARHLELDEQFALKFLNGDLLREHHVVERFMREARAACKIRSEHVARVHDVGTHEGAPFIVMEHLTGRDLATVVADEGALPVADAIDYTIQACEALAAAHALGIVHRDIKPENLFLVEKEGRRSIKLLDFGISKTSLKGADAPSRLTGTLSLGTPCYMSPEQIRSAASADAQSDLWSVAVVLYELLTDVQPFEAATVNEVCAAVLERTPRSVLELRPEVPTGVAEVLMRALQKDKSQRYADVTELAMALLPFAPRHVPLATEFSSMTMRVAPPPESSGQFVCSHTPTSWTPTAELPHLEIVGEPEPAPVAGKPRARMPWVVAAAGIVLLAVASTRVYPISPSSRQDEPRVAAAAASPPVAAPAMLPATTETPSATASERPRVTATVIKGKPLVVTPRASASAAKPVLEAGVAPAASDSAPALPKAAPSTPRVDLGY